MANEALANSFRRWGYLQADLDPMKTLTPFPHRELDEAKGAEADKWRKLYCGKIGVEFMHMPYPDRCEWVAEKVEKYKPKIDEKYIVKRLASAEKFESFIHTKYVGSKWFSLEGLAAMIPLLDAILESAADNGVETAVIGMAHRGRLSTLMHIAGSEPASIFACFEDVDPKSVLGSGDTKYHKGATGIYKTRTGKEVQIHLASNPSHLEAVNPVVMGRVRAKQQRIGADGRKKVVAILIHGDAAFAGQGIAAEALNLAEIPGYDIGGTIHIIANNLIGFTARGKALFTGRFASDIARRIPVPIFHVNAESPQEVVRVGHIASEYRAEFKNDVVIDLMGYRRFGHNEVDDPTTTAPVLYKAVKATPPIHQTYGKEIGLTEEELKKIEEDTVKYFQSEHDRGTKMTAQPQFAQFPNYWNNYTGGEYSPEYEIETGVPEARLKEIGDKATSVPKKFDVHPKIEKALELRREMVNGKKPLDWGAAEMLAFGSLLADGTPVRVAGQDSRRATFNHRQAVMYSTSKEGEEYTPLQNLGGKQAFFEVYDSCLSEAAVMGFEYGFSRDYPEALVCWEAQFGDFVNGAQIVIDQFLSAGENKWNTLSGLTLLLPHGYEGQGPEHSSARIERFLQLCGEDNMQVCYPSNAGQYFHLLRRQALQKWRKPLIVATPKSMLRMPAAMSQLKDLTSGSFLPVLDDEDKYKHAERIILCTGKIAHDLRAERAKQGREDTAIITIEQLYPFPEEYLDEVLAQYREAQVLVWAQEEPSNQGALNYVKPIIERLAGAKGVATVKRTECASPSTGSAKAHAIEQEAILKFAFAHFR